MKYNNFLEYYTKHEKLEYNFSGYFAHTPSYAQFDFEGKSLIEKINSVLERADNFQKMVVKIYYWEPDVQMCAFVQGFGEEINVIKSYKGRKLPGVGVVYLRRPNIPFLKTVLLCHYNNDFSLNPQLEIMPYCLVDTGCSYLVFELYDDRGYNLYEISYGR